MHLSHWQRDRLVQVLSQPGEGYAVARIEACFTLRRSATAHTHNFIGTDAPGLQRYRCCACGRTFNALDGNAVGAASTQGQVAGLSSDDAGLVTVRQSARDVGVHRNTSFCCATDFSPEEERDRPEHLHGTTEADETYFLEFEKRSPHTLTAQPASAVARRPGEGFPANRSACWWRGTVLATPLDFVTGKGPISKAQSREGHRAR